MPRAPKPNYNPSRRDWSFTFKRKKYYRSTEAEARALLRTLQANEDGATHAVPTRKDSQRGMLGELTLGRLVGDYLDYQETRVRPKTMTHYRQNYAVLIESLGAGYFVADMDEVVVRNYIDRNYAIREIKVKASRDPDVWRVKTRKPYSESTRHGIWVMVAQLIKWGCKPRGRNRTALIDTNPLAGEENPYDKLTRERVLTDDEWLAVTNHLDATGDGPNFLQYLQAGALTGARAMELNQATIEMVDLDKLQIVFPPGQRKGKRGKKRTKRVIYLHPDLRPMIEQRVKALKSGPLFRDANGNAWKADTVKNRIARMSKSLGFSFCVTDLRHTFATGYLKQGGSIAAAAGLLGHSSPKMVSDVYGHLEKDVDHLQASVSKLVVPVLEAANDLNDTPVTPTQ